MGPQGGVWGRSDTPTPPTAPPRVGRCEGHGGGAEFHPLQCGQAQRGWRVLVQRTAAAGAAQRYGDDLQVVTSGPRGAGQRSGYVTLGCTLPSLGQEPETCALSHLSLSPHLLAQGTSFHPQSTRPASVAAMRRSRAPCRSACGSAACGVSAGWARVGAGLHSGRCLWLGRRLSSERILNCITSSSLRAGIPGSSHVSLL